MTFLFLFTLISMYFQVNSADLSSDQTLLLSLKQHWGNPKSLDSWNSTSFLCDWPEVQCSIGAVKGLHLADRKISGTIPSSICQLEALSSINLAKNNISGHIPVSLYNCSSLETLDLSLNKLSGKIPGELFAMRSLNTLNLHGNRLSGEIPMPPKSLGEILPGLTAVDLSENQLSGDIIDSLFRLNSKYELSLCSNKFSGTVPDWFVDRYFSNNCLDPSNLCSDDRTKGLQSCPSNFCLDGRIAGFMKCNSSRNESKRPVVIIILETVGPGIVGFVILYYLARKCRITARCKKIWHLGPREEKEEWKMISFQQLNFNKNEILSGLTEENLIGDGGSGKVYRVSINQTGKSVAVKSILNASKSDHRLEEEFMAEIQTVGNVRHYNIVKLLCCISGKDLRLLVYQYFENMSLDQWLHGNNSRLDWPMRLHIAIGTAQGLCYLHHDCSPPIIHRDIKSRNILLDSDFNAKVADFGLAKFLAGNGDTETASTVAGTFGYIAPEYAYTNRVNRKADVYSFGVILLELTTGREAVTRGDHMNLAGWAQLRYRDTSAIVDALDAEIKESDYLDQIIEVFRLGVICAAALPSNRPSMKDCLHILQKCRNNSSSSSPVTVQISDHHPLL